MVEEDMMRLLGQRKDFIALGSAGSLSSHISAFLPCSPVPQGQGDMTQMNPTCIVGLPNGGTLNLGTHCVIASSKKACSLSWRETLHQSWKLLAENTILRNGPGNMWSVHFVCGIPSKNRKCCLGPRRDCLSQHVMFQKIDDRVENVIKNQNWKNRIMWKL